MRQILYYLSVLTILVTPHCSFSQDDEVSFNSEYIKNNDGKVKIEVNEVQELTYIMMSISDKGLKDSNMINHNTDYYEEIKNHFSQFKDHPAIKLVDTMLNESIINYILLSSNAYGFKFNGDKLVRTNVYNFPAKQVGTYKIDKDPIEVHRLVIEDFAKESNFRKFYNSHKPYYQEIINDYIQFGSIHKQKKWLEERFDYKINSYLVLTSPTIAGINATTTFEDNQFKQTLLYLPIITFNNTWSTSYNEAMNSRIIFTEIDHNYVGPLSEKYNDKIDAIFDKREVWVNKEVKATDHYPTPIKVFDEYLTWGLFILYAYDTFPTDHELHKNVIYHVNEKMLAKGFPNSKAFNEELVKLYTGSSTKKIEDIYSGLLEWSSKQ